jgi:hypothetical protein
LDYHCEAVCVCDQGFYGPACIETSEQLDENSKLILLLTEAIQSLIATDFVDSDNVIDWVELLSPLCSQMLGITDIRRNKISELVVELLHIALDLQIWYDDLNSLVPIIDFALLLTASESGTVTTAQQDI